MVDVEALAGQVASLVMAAVSAYGQAALTKAEDAAAGETVRLGQRLLAKMVSRRKSRAGIERAVSDLACALEDTDFQAALRAQIKKVLREDPGLAAELATVVPPTAAPGATVSGNRAIVVGGDNSGISSSGDGAINIQHR